MSSLGQLSSRLDRNLQLVGELTKALLALRAQLTGKLEALAGGRIFIVGDSAATADSEAMNSRDDPHRVALQRKKADLSGREFDYSFAPFAVTLLELQLTNRK